MKTKYRIVKISAVGYPDYYRAEVRGILGIFWWALYHTISLSYETCMEILMGDIGYNGKREIVDTFTVNDLI